MYVEHELQRMVCRAPSNVCCVCSAPAHPPPPPFFFFFFFFVELYGVAGQEFGISQATNNSNAATVNHFESMIHTWTPILKHDETDKCKTFDGRTDTKDIDEACKSEPFKSSSL